MPIFVVQKHAATHLHYDFRLEMDEVLKSWAVPKVPSVVPDEKRLAIMVDDHDISYADFEGEISEGNYGAGKVEIWDKGTYELEARKQEDGIDKKFVFFLRGKRLKGRFTLLKFDKAGANNWLLFKTKEEQKIMK
ncbi:3'-phosphoesterase [Candidatus Woesearchaeota archaeon]|nr:3'-phosphoesterase [Candidatus Woesearchaeota archaeon]